MYHSALLHFSKRPINYFFFTILEAYPPLNNLPCLFTQSMFRTPLQILSSNNEMFMHFVEISITSCIITYTFTYVKPMNCTICGNKIYANNTITVIGK